MSPATHRKSIPGLILPALLLGLFFGAGLPAQDVVWKPSSVRIDQFHPGYYAFMPGHDAIPSKVLSNPDFAGMKRKYSWRSLEPGAAGNYDFSDIENDLAQLSAAGKQLWIQVEYIQWNSTEQPKTPEYMWNDSSYGGSSVYHGNFERTVQNGGWYPLFWHPKVASRFAALYAALGQRFDGEANIEGISVGETSVRYRDGGASCSDWENALRNMVMAAKTAFPNNTVMSMVNFACFDLAEYADWLDSIEVSLGTPDTYDISGKEILKVETYPLFLLHHASMAGGPDVQWANYNRNDMTVAQIRDFAIDVMNPWYMFWRVREPYFSEELVDAIRNRKLPAAELFYANRDSAAEKKPKPPVLLQ